MSCYWRLLESRFVQLGLRCCHISPDSVNGRRTDRKSTKKCLSGGESRLGGDEGRRWMCKKLIKRMSNAYVPDK